MVFSIVISMCSQSIIEVDGKVRQRLEEVGYPNVEGIFLSVMTWVGGKNLAAAQEAAKKPPIFLHL
jgi:hypothetical protein